MSSENYVGIIMAENLRFLGEGSSAQGRPPKDLSTGTHWDIRTRALVDSGERDRTSVEKSEMPSGEKSCMYV